MQCFKGKVSGFSVKTVDTTGAGDAFVGALLVSIAKDTNIFRVIILYPLTLTLVGFIIFHCSISSNLILLLLHRMKQNLERL